MNLRYRAYYAEYTIGISKIASRLYHIVVHRKDLSYFPIM